MTGVQTCALPIYRQHLLTLADGQIVYCSHAGATVAVDAWTGQPTWGVRYPSRGPLTAEHEPSPRDLTPAVYADGRVYAAPLDSDRLFCMDSASGRVLWEVEGVEIVHLLGIKNGRLFVATRSGLLSIQTTTGETQWTQPTVERLPSLGRGLLAGSWLIWPTQNLDLPYRAVTLGAGHQQSEGAEDDDPKMPQRLAVGNLAFGQGCLAIAGLDVNTGLDELVVYVPPQRLRQLPPVELGP